MNEQAFHMLCLCRQRLKALRASLEALQGMVPEDAEGNCIGALCSAGQIAGHLERLDRELVLNLEGYADGRDSD